MLSRTSPSEKHEPFGKKVCGAVKREPEKLSRQKGWAFRLLAVAMAPLLLLTAELICRLGNWGRPTDYPDPFVGFSAIHPLFVQDATGRRYVIPPSRLQFFRPESFPVHKDPRAFRIFCFGGSTVQGRPYSTPTSFPTWLRLSLSAGDARRQWEVINCGGISYASYRLVPLVKECLQYQPDLFIICTGHNEFLEERTYRHIKYASPFVAGPLRWVSRLRTFTLLRFAVQHWRGETSAADNRGAGSRPVQLKGEVDALLDYRNGLRAYHRNDDWRRGVVTHFEFNLRRMLYLAENAGVPVLLVLPPSDLRDTPPFKAEDSPALRPADRTRWQELLHRARLVRQTNPRQAAGLLEEAVRLNPRHAGTLYQLGRLYDRLWEETQNENDLPRARTLYRQARDEDICPLRMISPLENVMRRVATETGTPLIDAHALLAAACPGGIADRTVLVDHVHPSPHAGHPRIAHALAEHMRHAGWFRPSPDWLPKRDAAFVHHRRALPPLYYQKGIDALRALEHWTRGEADGPLWKKL